jgi:Rieske Fe-S protein
MTSTRQPLDPSAPSTEPARVVDRRAVLQGTATVAGAGALAALLSACGDDGASSSTPTQDAQPEQQEQAPGATTSAGVIVASAEVPVGGGAIRIVEDRKVVVTQPAEGQFFGFSAVCTHEGCAVSRVFENTIVCPCHNSSFDASTGAVLGGPATGPLASIAVREDGDEIVFA